MAVMRQRAGSVRARDGAAACLLEACPTSFLLAKGARRDRATLNACFGKLRLQSFAPRTIESYVESMIGLATYYHKSPAQLKLEEIRSYLDYLLSERRLARSTCNLSHGRDHFLLPPRARPGKLRSQVSP